MGLPSQRDAQNSDDFMGVGDGERLSEDGEGRGGGKRGVAKLCIWVDGSAYVHVRGCRGLGEIE